MTKIIEDIRQQLSAKQNTKTSAQNFFKEEIKVYGWKTKDVQDLAKKTYDKIKEKSKKEIFQLSEDLLSTGYIEEAFIAFVWCHKLKKRYEEKDMILFEKWIGKYIHNWATCDTFSVKCTGEIILLYPQLLPRLKTWAQSKNRWYRRAAAVTLIHPARSGQNLKESLDIAKILLKDTDDLVQKGYGWLLKEQCKKHEKEVFDFVMQNRSQMPRTALRYAIEKMPEAMRRKAMG
jgi:3-methyladenine DNA glycosylase AlkD